MNEKHNSTQHLNAEDLRKNAVRNIFGGQPLYGLDEEYLFFYDETNNIRKFWIRDDGFNTNPRNFILGGILHKKSSSLSGTSGLVESLCIQKSAKEIKFNQLANGDYLGVLNSKKIRLFLEWLIYNNVFIHYTNFNILYWSLVDIIDSIFSISIPKLHQHAPYINHIKSEFFTLAKSNLEALALILKKYHFPNISRNLSCAFMNELANFLELASKKPQSDISTLVIDIVREAASFPELPFIMDNTDDVLIENFEVLYLRPLYIYPTSSHTFDNETKVKDILDKKQMMYKGKLVPYSFCDSMSRIEIQLSDVICGLLGSHFNFLEDHTYVELIGIKKNLNQNQQQTLSLINKLLNISNTQSNGFIHHVTPLYSDCKNNYFLYNLPFPEQLLEEQST